MDWRLAGKELTYAIFIIIVLVVFYIAVFAITG